jgi:hypothetical protein
LIRASVTFNAVILTALAGIGVGAARLAASYLMPPFDERWLSTSKT